MIVPVGYSAVGVPIAHILRCWFDFVVFKIANIWAHTCTYTQCDRVYMT